MSRDTFEHKLENAISEDMEQIQQVIRGNTPARVRRAPWLGALPESTNQLLWDASA